eukprot:gb/GECG01015568.1/.p1 GENE.gb/GECG01015568.1/~~gb/GECG01015568.1/.p1  ORF type:complete len:656 (+),score=62.15 gb/GECG01015568.1/:1-1968(+)
MQKISSIEYEQSNYNSKDNHEGGIRPPFPYEPYSIQTELMAQLYQCVDAGKVGIFESPTGTGKTLSIISSLLYYRENHPPQVLGDPRNSATLHCSSTSRPRTLHKQGGTQNADPDWLSNATTSTNSTEKLIPNKKLKERREEIEKMKKLPLHQLFADATITPKFTGKRPREQEVTSISGENEADKAFQIAQELRSQKEIEERQNEDSDVHEPYVEKIVFSSRTHSQLAQFIEELRKTPYSDRIRTVTLAGRKQLCVNENVQSLGDESAITEKCLELKDSKQSKGAVDDNSAKGCPYLNSQRIAIAGDKFLSQPVDIEDMKGMGASASVCPYYASHKAVPLADVVLVPYNLLLNSSARGSLDVQLDRSIVVIDEAHNLESAVYSCYESAIDVLALRALQTHINAYHERYKSRLGGKASSLCLQIDSFMCSLIPYLDDLSQQQHVTKTLRVSDFIQQANLEHINPWTMVRSMRSTQLSRKLRGFTRWYRQKFADSLSREDYKKFSRGNAIVAFQNFLEVLCQEVENARISIRPKQDSTIELKYFLLDASGPLKPIVDQCRSLVLTGGTMHPIDDFLSSLLPELPPSSLSTFSCNHVIPNRSIYAATLPYGLQGQQFEFTLAKRKKSGYGDGSWTYSGQDMLRCSRRSCYILAFIRLL